MSRHSYASKTWWIPGRAAAIVVMSTDPLSPNLWFFLILWRTLKVSSQPFENSNDGWSGYRRSMIFIALSRMRSLLRLTCSWLARNHSAKAASMTGNFTVFWHLELRLEVVALASSSADRLSVPNTVAWLTLSWWVSSSHLISSFCVAPRWSFLYRTRVRQTSSVIVVYCWLFFGMEKTLRMRMWRGGTCNAVPKVDPHANRGFFLWNFPRHAGTSSNELTP